MLLQAGDIIELRKGHNVYAEIPQHFIYRNQIGNFKKLERSRITIGEDKGGMNTDFMVGIWIVVKAGRENSGDKYCQNSYHVYCQRDSKLKNNFKMEIDFYQIGNYTAMIKENEVNVVGKAEATWSNIIYTEVCRFNG